jgi:dolichyl-phosphate-mannose--protein O-mannosyl transferase
VTSPQTEPPTAPDGSAEPEGSTEPQAEETDEARLRHRLLGYRPTDRFWGWAVPILITAIGGFLRFWQLNRPHQLVFDETYYVKQGASYLKSGYELSTDGDSTPKPDEKFIHGTTDVFLNTPDFVVHPPVGKWMIAFGEWLFGPASSWGWRFSAAAVGTLSILMIGRIARRLFGSTLMGGVAALLLAVEGEHFVMSRTGLLDIFVMFWALAGFGCLLIDRDRARTRLADRLAAAAADRSAAQVPDEALALASTFGATESAGRTGPPGLVISSGSSAPADSAGSSAEAGPQDVLHPSDVPGLPVAERAPHDLGCAAGALGPWLGLRPWRIAAAVSLGLCAGTKWSGAFFLAAFAVAGMMWDSSARRAAGIPRWFWGTAFKDTLYHAAVMIIIAPATYLATWAGWFHSSDAYHRHWGQEHPIKALSGLPDGLLGALDTLRGLVKYHQEMLHFNITLHSPHVYQSNPWSWSVLGRPTAFYYESYKEGVSGCEVTECSRAIIDLGNPVIWWGGTIAIAVLLFSWMLGRDWRAGAVLAGLVGGYLPWFRFQSRTIYTFYAVAFVPWMVLALTFTLGLVLGPRTASPRRRAFGANVAGAVVVLAVLAFAFFWPVLSGQVIPRSEWSARMWLPSWI